MALGHGLSYGSLKADGPSFLENLPDIVEADRKASGKDREQEEQMRIAWRYQNQKQPPGASPEEQHRKHGFNLQKNLDPAKLSSVPTRSWTGCDGEGNPYRDLFASIRDDLSLLQGEGDPDPKKPKTVLRIGLESLGSLNFGDDARHTHLKTFLLGRTFRIN